MMGMQGAIKMLLPRIRCICEYLERVKEGKAPFDHAIMREVGRLRDLVPAARDKSFEQRFLAEYNDVMLLSYLSTLSQGVQTLNTAADTFVRSRPHTQPQAHSHERGDKYYSKSHKY